MDESTYRIEARVARTLWWFRVRRKILRALVAGLRPPLPARALALDVGCGTGANLDALAGLAGRVVGVDRSRVPLALARAEGCARGALLVRADATRLPFRQGAFDLVTALDVLEHLEDDRAAAREIARVCAPEGAAVLFVPAHRILWGIQDEAAHHLRRYSRRGLVEVLEAAGLRPERVTHFNLLLLPPILAARLVLNRIRPKGLENENQLAGPLSNRVLEAVFALELPLLRRTDLRTGVSLAVVARRA